MTLASASALLQAAITLLTLVQANPNTPVANREYAFQVAQQAIVQANAALAARTSGECGNGDDFYDGGDGEDTLTYSGKRSEFVITRNADGSYTFKDTVPCRAGTDTVINVEKFYFADGTYTLPTLQPNMGTSVPTPAPLGSCTLSLKTSRGTEVFSSVSQSGTNARIMMWYDEPLTITWESKGASQAYDYNGQVIPVSGTTTIQPPQANRTYQYQFNHAGRIVICAAAVTPVSAVVDQQSLASNSSTPTISGSVTGVSSVDIRVGKRAFDPAPLYRITVPVVNGRWSAKISSPLSTGIYSIDIYGPSDQKLNYIASGTLAVNTSGAPSVAPSCSVSVAPSQVFANQIFTLSWSSTGMTNIAPTFATGPTIEVENHTGISGVILRGASGSQQYWTDRAESVHFRLGTGGVAGGPFVQYCAISVPVIGNTISAGTDVSTASRYQRPNMPFSVSGTTANATGYSLYVVLVPSSNIGNANWGSVQSIPGAITVSATANNGTWSASYPRGYPEGTHYTLLVFDPSRDYALVASALITFTDKG